jgi:2-methylcitrate dehydratase PrpD
VANRVTLECDQELDANFPQKTMARITIKTTDRKTIQINPQDWTHGDCQNPFTRDELIQKFFSFTESHLPDPMLQKIVDNVMDLENIDCTTKLTNLLVAK